MSDPIPSYRRRPSEALIPVNLPPVEGIEGDTSAQYQTQHAPACPQAGACPYVGRIEGIEGGHRRLERRMMHVEAENKSSLMVIESIAGKLNGFMGTVDRVDANVAKLFLMIEEDRRIREEHYRQEAERRVADAKSGAINWREKIVDGLVSALAPAVLIAVVWVAVRSGAVPIAGADNPNQHQEQRR